jgi:hypothetical protein
MAIHGENDVAYAKEGRVVQIFVEEDGEKISRKAAFRISLNTILSTRFLRRAGSLADGVFSIVCMRC